MEIIGDYGKKYKNGTEYALDRNRYNKPVDPVTKKGTINTSPCWNDWISLVENNREMFESLKKDEIDSLFNFYDVGYTSGMVLGMKLGRKMTR